MSMAWQTRRYWCTSWKMTLSRSLDAAAPKCASGKRLGLKRVTKFPLHWFLAPLMACKPLSGVNFDTLPAIYLLFHEWLNFPFAFLMKHTVTLPRKRRCWREGIYQGLLRRRNSPPIKTAYLASECRRSECSFLNAQRYARALEGRTGRSQSITSNPR